MDVDWNAVKEETTKYAKEKWEKSKEYKLPKGKKSSKYPKKKIDKARKTLRKNIGKDPMAFFGFPSMAMPLKGKKKKKGKRRK